MSKGRLKGFLVNTLLLTASIVASIFLIEILFLTYEKISLSVDNAEEEGVINLRELNYNDATVSAKKLDNEFRILSFGDSFGYSIMVNDYSYSGVIARRMNEVLAKRFVRVVNLGEPATSVYQYMGAYKHWSKKIEHDAAIFNIYLGNDLLDVALRYVPSSWKPVSAFEKTDIYMADNRSRKRSVVPHKYPLRTLDYAYALYLNFTLTQTNQKEENSFYNVAANLLPEDVFYDTNATQMINFDYDSLESLTPAYKAIYQFLRFVSAIRKKGVKVFVSLGPNETQVDSSFRSKIAGMYYLDLNKYDLGLSARIIEAISKRVDPEIEVVNLTNYFICRYEAGEDLYYKTNTHWSLEGNDLAGNVIATHILASWFDRSIELPSNQEKCIETNYLKKNEKVSAKQISNFLSEKIFDEDIQNGKPEVFYSLAKDAQGEIITASDGALLRVIPNALRGVLEKVTPNKDYVTTSGWAANVKSSRLPETILIFVDGRFAFSGKVGFPRMDVAKYFKDHALRNSGFRFELPITLFKDIDNAEIRFFAVSKEGVATELFYPEDYKWGKKS